jgi:hypothetical protein
VAYDRRMTSKIDPRGLATRGLFAAALAWGPLAVPADAQTQTQTQIPTPAAQNDSAWILGVDAQQSYESNIQYRPDGDDDFVTRAGATLRRHLESRRGRLDLELGAGGLLYRTHSELDLFTWSVAVDGTRQLSRRSSLQAEARSSQGYARETVLLDQTLVPPYAVTRTDSGAVSWLYHLARDLEGRLEAEGDHVDFSSPGFVNGWTVTARARVEQASERAWGLGGATEYERTSNAGVRYEIERLFGIWRSNLARGLSTRLEAGVAGFRVLDSPDPRLDLDTHLTPMATAELAGQLGRSTLAVRLAREIDQTYGLGTVGVTYDARLAYTLRLGSRVDAFATGDYARFLSGSAPLGGPTRALRTTAGARYVLSDGWALQADYSYWHWYDPVAGWGNHTVGLAVRRAFDWR